jgi:hypothetical protein
MGMRQVTFFIPDEVAEQLAREVPAMEQSTLVTRLLRHRLQTPRLTEAEWTAASEGANADAALNAEIDEWQDFSDPIQEPWNAPSPR